MELNDQSSSNKNMYRIPFYSATETEISIAKIKTEKENVE